MDFAKLDSNEKLATYGAIAAIVGAVLAAAGSFGFGIGWLGLILALAMLVIVFLPQWSPQTTLPGSKGTLMLIVGGIAAIFAVLGLLTGFGVLSLLTFSPLFVIGWLLGIVGGLLMGWAGWQAFQAEGGKFALGTGARDTTARDTTADRQDAPPAATTHAAPPPPAATTESTPPPPPATTAAPPPTATTAAPPATEPPPSYDETDEERRDRP